jgi:xylan 1,4-beta-xylosidase
MKTYQNPLRLPGQDGEAGLGDPFVFRFNGRYYMLPSPSGVDTGIIMWESEDMYEWRYLGNLAVHDELVNIYAPEMFYYNGTFYLIGSPRGEGHYLYISESPTGPFRKLTDNLGLTIDGSMFADDDGSLYFFHAEYPSIHGHRMDPDGTIHDSVELYGTSMGHWTEGPGVFKRNNRYYITMTGNHLMSRGYRIDYAISEEGPLGPYQVPRNKTLLVNTKYEYGSLGHSSTVIGPDLDSYWIFYHSFLIEHNNQNKQDRRRGRFIHMDRMVFSGNELHVSGPSLSPCKIPERPDFYGWADEDATAGRFLKKDGCILSTQEMGTTGTAEICLVPGNGGSALFAVRGEEHVIEVFLDEGYLTVMEIQGTQSQLLLKKPLFAGFRQDVLHTIRLEASSHSTAILVDQMLQSTLPAMNISGRIGTRLATRTSFIAFNRYVNQSSDRMHYHYIPGFVSALTATSDSRGEVFRCQDGEQRLFLRKGDRLSFRINVAKAGIYRIQATMQAYTPSVINWSFSDYKSTISLDRMEVFRRVEIGTIKLKAGFQEWSITLTDGEMQLRGFDLFPASNKEAAEYTGLDLCRNTVQIEGDVAIDRMEGLQMDRPGQVLCQFGDRFHTDGFIETDMIFRGDDVKLSAGLFLRVSENSTYPHQVEIGHRGYYIGFNGQDVFVWRMDFGKKVLVKRRCPLIIGNIHRIRAEICCNEIRVYLDGKLVVTTYDNESLPFGVAAVGSFGARVIFNRVKYELD